MVVTVPAQQPYTGTETVLNNMSIPVTGAVFSELSSSSPSGHPIAWSVVDNENGTYDFTFTPSYPGEWELIVQTIVDGDAQVFEISVNATSSSVPIYLDTYGGTDLRTLRRMVARVMGDHKMVTATSGSTTTISDPFDLVDNLDHYRGAELVCVTGHPSNVGLKRKVVSSSYEQYTITFIPALPEPVEAGDTFDIYNFGQVPMTIQQYTQAINDAIRMAFPANTVGIVMNLESPLLDGVIPIPAQFTHINGVSWKSVDDWYSIPPSRFQEEGGWFVDQASRTLTFGGAYGYELKEKAVRIYGETRAPELVLETDVTTTDAEWIVDQAVSLLLHGRMDQTTFAIGQARGNRADQLRSKMMRPRKPNTVAIF